MEKRVGYIFYISQRRQAIAQRPLVLIHAPLNRDRVAVGRGVDHLRQSPLVRPAAGALAELWAVGTPVYDLPH